RSFDGPARVAGFGKLALAGLGLVSALALLNGTWFTVEPSHVAYLVRWNQVVTPHDKPIGPGLHVKLPIAEHVDSISVATDSFVLPEAHVFTRDSQVVDLQLGVTYRVPPNAAYHLLYEVGRSGNVDIARNLNQVMLDRTRTVISRHDIAQVAGPERE